jgi:hypothetical protein
MTTTMILGEGRRPLADSEWRRRRPAEIYIFV